MGASESLPPFAALYRAHFDDVWSALRRLGVPEAMLEDAVHDVFMVVHRRRDEYEGRGAARTWLLGIARRIAFRYRRTLARTERRRRALAMVDPAPMDADEHLARREGWHALQAFLEQLDERKRDAFVLGELERLNRRELGAALGVSPDTAYSRLRAARARFSETFAPGPSRRAALAAGRTAPAASAQSRQRVWLLLGPGLAPTTGTTVLWGTKVVGITAGLALGGLAAVSLVTSGLRPTPPARASVKAERAARRDEPPRPRRLPIPRVAEGPLPESPAASPPTAETPMQRPSRDEPRRTTRAGRPATPSPSTPADASTISAEAALLEKARAALATSNAAGALALLREHRARFPRGMFVEEREASSIRARCALGQHETARADAQRFARTYPGSAYLAAVDRACADR